MSEKIPLPVPPFITWNCSYRCKEKGPFVLTNPEQIVGGHCNAVYKCIKCGENVQIAPSFWPMIAGCAIAE